VQQLSHNATSADYADRLLLAHFAIITVGLVAAIGAWQNPLTGLGVLFGLGALLAFVCTGLRPVFWQPPMRWRCAAPAISTRLYRLECGRAGWPLLSFIRRAHLACGAPPQPASFTPWSHWMGIQSRCLAFESPSLFFLTWR